MIEVTALPAREGDALWIEWRHRDRWYRMLIDGGSESRAAAPAALTAALAGRTPAERHFELMICTHIDADHISGLMGLLQYAPEEFTVDDVWFNGRRHLHGDVLSARQGDVFGALLDAASLPWNMAFGGEAVVVPDTGPLPTVKLPGLTLTLLSPTWRGLDQLAVGWPRVAALRSETTERAGDLLGGRDAGLSLGELAAVDYVADVAAANASSIAFLAEHEDGGRILFGADAHAEELVASLQRLRPDGPLRLDLCKVPHHGSAHNMSPELLRAVACENWLFSTSGSRFGHPSRQAVARIVSSPGEPTLWFNYLSDTTEEFARADVAARHGFRAVHPPAARPGITLAVTRGSVALADETISGSARRTSRRKAPGR